MAKRISEIMAENAHTDKLDGKADGREKKAERHPQAGIAFEFRDGKGAGALYGELKCYPGFDPDKGIQFVVHGYYWRGWGQIAEYEDFVVTLHKADGADAGELYNLWHQIGQAKVEYVREGELIREIEVKEL